MSTKGQNLENTVMPALRQDLIAIPQIYEGKEYFVIKDPISLKYFRLSKEDYSLACLFDGKRTFAEIRAAFLEQYPQLRLSHIPSELTTRIMTFANELAMMQFIGVKGNIVRKRGLEKTSGQFKPQSLLGRIFWFQMSLFDPDELFGKMAERISWIWTKKTMWASLLLMAAALFVFIQNYSKIAPSMGAFFTPRSLILLWLGIVLVKVIHELGHGLTCKHFGGEVHEIGVMVMLLTPFFYVNVTDSWVMQKKRHRILIAAAGIYIELVIAAVATFLWAASQPGILQQALFNIMLITSFWTIFFNANPLARFDGYYILTDVLEIPNLRTKSRVYMNTLVQKFLFGKVSKAMAKMQSQLPEKHFFLFAVYSLLSYCWWLLVLTRMTRMFVRLLSPYGLEQLGEILSWFVVVAYIIMPCIMFIRQLGSDLRDWQRGGRFRRLSWVAACLAFLFCFGCLLPVEKTITRSSAIELATPEAIRPVVSGFVAEVFVKEGDLVKAGEPIARLFNREVVEAYESAHLHEQAAEKAVSKALGLDRPSELIEARALLEQYNSAKKDAERDYSGLLLRAENDGVVLTRDLQRKKGTLVKQGETFCELSPLHSMRIKIPLFENEVRYVMPGQWVRLKAFAHPETSYSGKIIQAPLAVVGSDLSPNLSLARDGDIPTKTNKDGREVPAKRIYNAQILVDNFDTFLRPGMTGRVKIYAGKYRLGKLLWQELLDSISLDYRL